MLSLPTRVPHWENTQIQTKTHHLKQAYLLQTDLLKPTWTYPGSSSPETQPITVSEQVLHTSAQTLAQNRIEPRFGATNILPSTVESTTSSQGTAKWKSNNNNNNSTESLIEFRFRFVSFPSSKMPSLLRRCQPRTAQINQRIPWRTAKQQTNILPRNERTTQIKK